MKETMAKSYWLFKTEPTTYSFEQLLEDKKTNWNGIRNYQARNYLRTAKKGDLALIYHSGKDKAVIGIAEIISAPYPEKSTDKGDWVQLDLRPVSRLNRAIALAEIKNTPSLQKLPLIRHTRLSCMPVEQNEFETIKKLGQNLK